MRQNTKKNLGYRYLVKGKDEEEEEGRAANKNNKTACDLRSNKKKINCQFVDEAL